MPAFSRTARAGSRARARGIGDAGEVEDRVAARDQVARRGVAGVQRDGASSADAARARGRRGGRARTTSCPRSRSSVRGPRAEEAGRAGDEELHAATQSRRYSATLCRYSNGVTKRAARRRRAGSRRRASAATSATVTVSAATLRRPVERARRAGSARRRRRARRRSWPGRRRRASAARPPAASRRNLSTTVCDSGAGVLDRARPVDDPEPEAARASKPCRRAYSRRQSSA